MDRFDIGATAVNKEGILAAILILRGATFQTQHLFRSNGEVLTPLPNSLHINLTHKNVTTGSNTKKSDYAGNGYSKGWFNLDDARGLSAFAWAIAQSFHDRTTKKTTWMIGQREAIADPKTKSIAVGCTVVPLSTIKEMVAELEKK